MGGPHVEFIRTLSHRISPGAEPIYLPTRQTNQWPEFVFALNSYNLARIILCSSLTPVESKQFATTNIEWGVPLRQPMRTAIWKPWSEQIFKKFREDGKVDATDAPSIQEQKQRCPICLSNFRINDSNFLCPDCRHEYHHTCIQPWLTLNPTCPTCRHGLVPALVKRPGAVWRTRAQRFRGLTSGNHRASDFWREGGLDMVLFIAIIVTSYLLIRSALS
ncbi:hypothetical protein KEM48_003092 [Puccinia striiformis f. sp. tritici PST-130]|nr:hypothetical protein KEM48_003092 [Puccinia striiformis f. sp. tritici PST-130]